MDDASHAPEPTASALPQAELDALTDQLVEKLKTVFDPEIPVDIYELGLIYKVDVSDDKDVVIEMTLTAPGCPVAGEMPDWVRDAVMSIPEVKSCTVNLVFDPPWDPSRMSDEAKLATQHVLTPYRAHGTHPADPRPPPPPQGRHPDRPAPPSGCARSWTGPRSPMRACASG